MECPQCGYVMEPFDEKCPRCARQGITVLNRPEEEVQQAPVEPPPPPPPVPRAMPAPPVTRAPVPRRREQEQRSSGIAEPEVGWGLAITAWLTIGFNGLIIILLLILNYWIQNNPNVPEDAKQSGNFIFLMILLTPGLRLAGAIAALNGQRWGVTVMLITLIYPLFLGLFGGRNPGANTLLMSMYCLPFIPTLLAVIFGFIRWNELE